MPSLGDGPGGRRIEKPIGLFGRIRRIGLWVSASRPGAWRIAGNRGFPTAITVTGCIQHFFGVRVAADLAGMFGTNRCLVETVKRLGLGGGPVLTKRERFARKRWWPGCTGVRLRVREGFAGAGRAGPCIAGRGTRVAGMHLKFKHHV